MEQPFLIIQLDITCPSFDKVPLIGTFIFTSFMNNKHDGDVPFHPVLMEENFRREHHLVLHIGESARSAVTRNFHSPAEEITRWNVLVTQYF